MDSGGEDTRKKRHADDGGRQDDSSPPADKFKKRRPEKRESTPKNETNTKKEGCKNSGSPACIEPVDIETAMHRLFSHNNGEEESWLIRAGHAGDAPAIESYYRKAMNTAPTSTNEEKTEAQSDTNPRERNNSESSSPSLELWLSEAMGDEDTPPSVFSMLANVSSSSKDEDDNDSSKPSIKELGAVALFTIAWLDNQRILRVEWFHVNKSLSYAKLLERRMWMRLSALALMTGACLSVPDNVQIESHNAEPSKGE